MDTEFLVNIVDDDNGSRESISELLCSLDLATRTFPTAEQFLDEFDGAPGCVITDLRMPTMSGLELLNALRDRYCDIPVIFVSGFPETSVVVDAMQRGAITFLEKPYCQNELWNAVRAAVKHDADSRRERRAIESRLKTLNGDEQAVLELLVEGYSNKSIAQHLDIGLRTAESRRHAILKTMQVDSVARLVQDIMILNRGRRPASLHTHH